MTANNVMRLSLLRSPKAPDPKADQGNHRFTYALMPHEGDFRQARVVQEAYNLNVPLRVEPLNPGAGPLGPSHSFFSINSPNVIAECVKIGVDKNSAVIRLYEAYGARCEAAIRFGLPVNEVRRTDMLERETGAVESLQNGAVTLKFRPFEIVTLKLILAGGHASSLR